MSLYYQIKVINEVDGSNHSKSHKNAPSTLSEVTAEEALGNLFPFVAAISPEEFEGMDVDTDALKRSPMALIESESNYIDVYPDFIVGSFSIPEKAYDAPPVISFAFYLDKDKLLFVDDDQDSQTILMEALSTGVVGEVTPAHCLYYFIKEFLLNEYEELGKFEDSMEDYEERLIQGDCDFDVKKLMEFRRMTMKLGMNYQQITAIAEELEDNENKVMSKGDARSFSHIVSLSERLTSRAEVLKEYSMQLHEMQETHIEFKQNSIMQVFTIVTVLFAPLTLVTGWFGMNLQVIPGLDWSFMWIALIIGALILTTLLLLLFYKKKWL